MILIDKPFGYTSFDIVKKIKKYYPGEKVGHSGTLDPGATGLLIIGVGREETRQLWKIQQLDKDYICEINFGVITDTWDMEYREDYEKINLKDKIPPRIEEIKQQLDKLIPYYKLPVPPFSAKKHKWKKSYELAREWEEVLTYQRMYTYSYKIREYNFPKLELELNVWSWNFVRSIAYWLGTSFNLGWTISYLRRTRIGNFYVDDAYNVEDFEI